MIPLCDLPEPENEHGLTDESDLTMREKYGKNEITREKPISALRIFMAQFKDLLIWILIFWHRGIV